MKTKPRTDGQGEETSVPVRDDPEFNTGDGWIYVLMERSNKNTQDIKDWREDGARAMHL